MKANTDEGNRKYIHFQVQFLKPMDYHGYMQWSKSLRPSLDRTTKRFSKRVRVEFYDVEDKHSLAKTIKGHFDFGSFNVLFYSKYVMNIRFNPRFKCKGEECDYYKSCRMKERFKQGMACKKNKRFAPNMLKKATLEINPSTNKDGFTYRYTYNRMQSFWFWLDD